MAGIAISTYMCNITLKCIYCDTAFISTSSYFNHRLTKKRKTVKFCSLKCWYSSKLTTITCKCKECCKEFKKRKESKQLFCTQTCSGSYNNKHRKTGTRVSKLEVWLRNELVRLYPALDILFNHKKAIGSELDIYIPLLNLAFEINGVHHYRVIYSDELFENVQRNDRQKVESCVNEGIDLYAINTSTQVVFKPSTSRRFLDYIVSMIDQKSGGGGGTTVTSVA